MSCRSYVSFAAQGRGRELYVCNADDREKLVVGRWAGGLRPVTRAVEHGNPAGGGRRAQAYEV